MSDVRGLIPDQTRDSARCPHMVYRDVLGPAAVAGLLDYVMLHRDRFRPAPVRSRGIEQEAVDRGRRDGLLLGDLEPREFEISSYGDGGHFAAHLDTTDLPDRVRILSCVYYFARSPIRFGGGELRLRGFPHPSGEGSPPVVDVLPETDTLVAFPSWLVHQILPIRMPSAAWADRRFAINCWIHRRR
jgi:hypothetical protein